MLRNASHDFSTGRIYQPGQLLQMFRDVPCVFRSLAGRSHQHRALDRVADWDQWSDNGAFLVIEFAPELRRPQPGA
jgi:hypothetical protein